MTNTPFLILNTGSTENEAKVGIQGQNASMVENIKASPNSIRDLNVFSYLTFGFVAETEKKSSAMQSWYKKIETMAIKTLVKIRDGLFFS